MLNELLGVIVDLVLEELLELLGETVERLLGVALDLVLLDEEVDALVGRLKLELVLELDFEETLVAELDGEVVLDKVDTVVDEDEVRRVELEDAVWLDEVTWL